jgi:4-hydroxymandelate synthase
MAAQDIEYVEFYAGDDRPVVDYFVSSFGFTRTAESADSGGRSTLLRQGSFQLVVTTGTGTEAFLEAHGDGVADIAFACDDIDEDHARAVAHGASVIATGPGYQVVSGFFGVRHTLVTRRATRGTPPGRAWTSAAAGTGRPAGHVHLLDHVAVCVEAGSLADCVGSYESAFGIPRYSSEYIQVGEQAMDSIVVRSKSGGITFTILEQDPEKKAGQVEAFISRNGGSGVQHLAFLVDDIVPAVREYRSRGIEFLSTPDAYYDMLSERLPDIRADVADLRDSHVLADRDEWGYLLQLFTRSPYKRNTMFYEFVQRRGARGFGSANIKALYEAVERDGLAAG